MRWTTARLVVAGSTALMVLSAGVLVGERVLAGEPSAVAATLAQSAQQAPQQAAQQAAGQAQAGPLAPVGDASPLGPADTRPGRPASRPALRVARRVTLRAAPKTPARVAAPSTLPLRPVVVPFPDQLPAPQPAPLPSVDFALTTFNVLGASHTAAHGTHASRPSGRVRALRAVALLARHRSDVVGFQELQGPQLSVLERHTDLDFYPGFSLGHLGTDNSLGWRSDEWTAVEEHTVAIPYFGGHPRQMPYVLLRNRATGLLAWFVNVHNPADTKAFHAQQGFRVRASLIEARLTDRLTATGLPVFLTGDMNERASYFCRITATTSLHAARGGTDTGGHCRPDGAGALGIDWIFGSPGVEFTGYDEDHSPLDHAATDHPVVTAQVHLAGTVTNPGD